MKTTHCFKILKRNSVTTHRAFYSLSSGFTFIELLLVVAILAVQAIVLLPGLAKTKTKDEGITCMNNNKQLMLAWRFYAEDNQNRLPHAYGEQHGWVGTSSLDFNGSNPSNFDINQDITKGPLWKYSGASAGIYKCPSDKSVVVNRNIIYPRVRSMSMSSWMGGNNGLHTWFGGAEWNLYRKTEDILNPGPSSTWVFIDEREDSINDGSWITWMPGYPSLRTTKIVDYPGSYHDNGATFSFADGHVETKRWDDPRTTPELIVGRKIPLNVACSDNRDVLWIQERTTRLLD